MIVFDKSLNCALGALFPRLLVFDISVVLQELDLLQNVQSNFSAADELIY